MSTASPLLEERLEEAVSVPIERWKFTVSDYYRMAEAGILKDTDRVELIDAGSHGARRSLRAFSRNCAHWENWA